jgi:hypothetical protein
MRCSIHGYGLVRCDGTPRAGQGGITAMARPVQEHPPASQTPGVMLSEAWRTPRSRFRRSEIARAARRGRNRRPLETNRLPTNAAIDRLIQRESMISSRNRRIALRNFGGHPKLRCSGPLSRTTDHLECTRHRNPRLPGKRLKARERPAMGRQLLNRFADLAVTRRPLVFVRLLSRGHSD